MDKFEQLAMEAQLAVCILANADVSDIELVNLKAVPLHNETTRDFTGRGLRFIGVIGIVQGVPRSALAVPLDPVRTSALSQAFIAYTQSLLDANLKPKDDFELFMTRLCALEDPRLEA